MKGWGKATGASRTMDRFPTCLTLVELGSVAICHDMSLATIAPSRYISTDYWSILKRVCEEDAVKLMSDKLRTGRVADPIASLCDFEIIISAGCGTL